MSPENQRLTSFEWQQKYESLAKVDKPRAREINQRQFWNGIPCKEGHVWWRHTQNGACVICCRRRGQEYNSRKIASDSRMLDVDKKQEQLALERELASYEL